MKGDMAIGKYLKNLGGRKTVLLLAAVGVLLLILGAGLTKGKPAEAEIDPTEAYLSSLTASLTSLCSEIEGVGTATVVITLAEGERKEYSGSKLLSTEMPRVEGVAVVCAGGGDPNVRAELTELLTSLLGIGSHRVHISRRK